MTARTLIAAPKSASRILLIEDNDVNRQLLADYLQYCGYSVMALPDGDTFCRVMTEFQPHLILLDLKLPGVDGFELLETVRQTPQWQAIPIIVVSAYAFQADQNRAMNLGASQYLVKPVQLADLMNAIAGEL